MNNIDPPPTSLLLLPVFSYYYIPGTAVTGLFFRINYLLLYCTVTGTLLLPCVVTGTFVTQHSAADDATRTIVRSTVRGVHIFSVLINYIVPLLLVTAVTCCYRCFLIVHLVSTAVTCLYRLPTAVTGLFLFPTTAIGSVLLPIIVL